MAHDNSPAFFTAIYTLASDPLGKLLIGALIWAGSFMYAVGGLKSEMKAMSARLDRIERKVDSLDIPRYPIVPQIPAK